MAYRTRYTRRRTGGRRRRTLSSYHIATRTSARSQARQIYALNKRVTAIQRRTKPEIMTWTQSLIGTPNFSSTGGFCQISAVNPTQNTDNPMQGNFARLLTCKLYGSITYATMSETVQPITFRVVILQTMATRGTSPTASDIFNGVTQNSSTLTGTEARTAIFGPLSQGLARSFRVLNDRKFYLSYQRPLIAMNIKRSRLSSFWKDPDNTEEVAKGNIYVAIIGYAVGTSSSTQPFTINAQTKIAYTDA